MKGFFAQDDPATDASKFDYVRRAFIFMLDIPVWYRADQEVGIYKLGPIKSIIYDGPSIRPTEYQDTVGKIWRLRPESQRDRKIRRVV